MMTTRNRIKTVLTIAVVALAVFATSANAASILAPVSAVTANHGGDQYGNGLISLFNGSGMDTTADPADPSTWICITNHYNQEWMGNFLDHLDPPDVPTLNSKLAWVVFDLGSSINLQDLYIWNIRYQGGIAGTQTYNIYYTDSPTVALPAEPSKGVTAITGLTPQGDYDFAGSGWSKHNTTGVLTAPKGGDSVVALGITARYIGIEILSNHGDIYKGGRVGFSEVAFAANADPNLPDVDAGPDMISWSGQAVTMDANVVNNDTNEPQGTLTYLWTADAASVADPNLDVAITDANQEDATVTITKTAPTGDATVVRMTLAVTLEGKDPVKDTMTIDVYDDACLAAKAVGPVELDATDIDENCITNFVDFALMAITWLDDYTLTKAVAK
jgi:hypothetical protein